MKANKDKIILEWISQCDALTGTPLFLWLGEHNGDCALVPIPMDRQQGFIADEFREVVYDFMLRITLPVSEYTDCVNTNDMFKAREWQDWIDAQEIKGNYPDLGKNCCCYSLQNLTESPYASGITEDGHGVFQFSVRLKYLEELNYD